MSPRAARYACALSRLVWKVVFGHITCQDSQPVPQSRLLPKTTTAVAGVHRH